MQDYMLVCLNGHKINPSFKKNPDRNRKFCQSCGSKTIVQCPNCNAPIKGKKHSNYVVTSYSPPVKNHCDNCGQPYPWKIKNDKLKEEQEKAERENVNFDINGLKIIFNRFHQAAKQLLDRYNNRETIEIRDEYDVQDLLHSFLRLFYDDVRSEEWNPSYAGGSTRNDFLLKNEEIVIEVKKTNRKLKDKQIGEQLIIDIEKYQSHPNCKELFCFVYDPDEFIKNPTAIINDLMKPDRQIKVTVVIKPER